MIMSSGRFSGGGGGGGSHRDVVFNAKLVADPKNAQVLGGIAKQFEDLQRKMNNLRVGTAGGASGRPGAGGRAGGASLVGSSIMFDDPAESRRQTQFFDRAIREEQRIIKQNAAERAKDLRMLKKDTKDVMEGMIGLSRAFVLFGVSSEENLEKAVRALAKFEGAVAGVKGGMKLSEGLGGLLGAGASRMGVSAGAGGMGLGAAGIAAGVGVLGAGFAIHDQIQYMRTGQIGAYSQGYASKATGAARSMQQNRFPGMNVGAVGLLNTGLEAAGFGDAARAEDRYAKGSQAQVGGMADQLKYSQQRLAIEQQILSLMDREVAKQKDATAAANNRMQGAAFAFQGLSGMDQRGVTRLRDKFLKDPSSVRSRQMQNLMPYVGQAEQEQIAREMQKRSGGFFAGGGFSREREAKLNASGEGARISQQIEMQREFVIQLKTEDEERFKSFEQALKNALEVADEAAQKKLQEIADQVVELRRQMQQQTLNRNNATSNSYGFGS